jgi:hypothetical protein
MQPAALARLKSEALAPTLTPPKRPAEDEETLLGEAARAALTPPTTPDVSTTATIVDAKHARLVALGALAVLALALLSWFVLSRH